MEFLQPIFEKAPAWVIQVLAVVGMFRLFFKPIMSAIAVSVAQSESKKDDEILNKVESHWLWKAFVWCVDYLGSIKLPVKK
jgi:DMSO reductase anchor subunit